MNIKHQILFLAILVLVEPQLIRAATEIPGGAIIHEAGTSSTATTILRSSDSFGAQKVRGSVVSLKSNRLTISSKGPDLSFDVSGSNKAHLGSTGTYIDLSDLAEGDEVEVTYKEGGGKNIATQIIVVGPCQRYPKLPACKKG